MKIQVDLKARLVKERENGAPAAVLFAQIALFATILFLRETTFFSENDANGFKTALLYYIGALMLLVWKYRLSQPSFNPNRPYQFKPKVTANSILGFALGVNFGGFFEISFSSFCVALSLSVLLLAVLVILKRTDLGLFGFLVGTVGWVGCNLYGFTSTTWVVVAICIFLSGLKFWLDKNWLEIEEDRDQPSSGSIPQFDQIILLLTYIAFLLQWDRDFLRTKCQLTSRPVRFVSCPPSSLVGLTGFVVVLVLWFISSIATCFYSSIRDRGDTKEERIISSDV